MPALDPVVDVPPVLLPDAVLRLDEGDAVGHLLELAELRQVPRTVGAARQMLFEGAFLLLIQFIVQVGHHEVLVVLAGHDI